MTERLNLDPDADALISRASELFSAAPGNPHSPFRYPVLATVGQDGSPNARVLVLRAASPVTWRATLHTDRRAEKVSELEINNAAMLVFYDHEAGLQLRLKVALDRNIDNTAREAIWAELPASNRPNYQANPPTGSVISTAGDGIDPVTPQSGYENFAVITLSAETADILQLSRSGNRRYRLDVALGTGSWLVP